MLEFSLCLPLVAERSYFGFFFACKHDTVCTNGAYSFVYMKIDLTLPWQKNSTLQLLRCCRSWNHITMKNDIARKWNFPTTNVQMLFTLFTHPGKKKQCIGQIKFFYTWGPFISFKKASIHIFINSMILYSWHRQHYNILLTNQ